MHLDAGQVERLMRYWQLVHKWNRVFNLVSRRDMGRFAGRHLIDSLSGAPLLRGDRVLDLGSGAGLPGIPLAVADPRRHFVLNDRSARRVRFLKQVVRDLELTNAEVHEADGRTLPAEALYDTVVTRAVATPDQVWDMVGDHVAAGGCIVLYQRTHAEADGAPAANQISRAGTRATEHGVDIPGLNQRHILLVVERE